MKSLTESEEISVVGGGISENSPASYDLAYIFGFIGGALYGIVSAPLATPNWHSGMLGYSPVSIQ